MRLQVFLGFFTALAALISIPAIFIILLQVLEPPPISDKGIPFTIINQPITSGQFITYLVTRCSTDPFISYPFIYGRAAELVQEEGLKGRIALPNSTSIVTEPGCDTLPISTGPIPTQVVSGKYHLEGSVTSIGRFRLSPSTLLWTTESFEVVSSDVPTR